MIYHYILPSVLVIVLFVLFTIYRLLCDHLMYQDLEKVYTILNTALQQVYNLIYRNHIVSYKVSGEQLNQQLLNTLRKQFLENVYVMIGPKVRRRLIKIHGNQEAIDMYILFRFEEMVDQDIVLSSQKEIRS